MNRITYDGHTLAAGTLWVWEAFVTGRFKPSTIPAPPSRSSFYAKTQGVSKDIADAYVAVDRGFAASPQPATRSNQSCLVPIIGHVIESFSAMRPSPLAKPALADPCLVIAPTTPCIGSALVLAP